MYPLYGLSNRGARKGGVEGRKLKKRSDILSKFDPRPRPVKRKAKKEEAILNFKDAVMSCLTNYATFQGRAPRSEYWYFVLFYSLVTLIATLIDNLVIGQPILQVIAAL